MSLLSGIFGDPQLDNIDSQIDNIIHTLPLKNERNSESENNVSELIHQFLAIDDKFSSDEKIKKNIFYQNIKDKSSLTNDINTLLDKLSIEPDRANRYKIYEEIYGTIPMIKKMMKVWLANLLQKNPVSGKSLLVKELEDEEINTDLQDEDLENKKEIARLFIDNIIDYFDIVGKLKERILPYQQMYGDAFVEIVNLKNFKLYNKDELDNNDLFIGESVIPKTKKNHIIYESDDQKIKRISKKIETASFEDACDLFADIFIDTNYDPLETLTLENSLDDHKNRTIVLQENNKHTDSIETFYEYVQNNAGELKPFLKLKNSNSAGIKKKRGRPKKSLQESTVILNKLNSEIDLSQLFMMIHKPTNILILETNYGSKIGYLEISEKENIQSTNITQQLSTIIGRIVSVSQNKIDSKEEILARIVRSMIKKILSNQKVKDNDPEKIIKSLKPEVLNSIKRLIIETDKDNPKRIVFKKLKTRYIPLEKMFHFQVPSSEYYPYGQSFIDPLVLQAKLYILSQLSNIIMKLSRAAPVRKWIVDVGATQGQAKYIQQLKREMYNQRVTIDNILSFKSMPKILSDFKDIAVYRKGGVSHLDMEVQSLGDASVKVQDLQDQREELIALSVYN